ncbi:Asp-tRNA(Asn)/Glu-tRNA(Gln) amidotransferase subunit GatB [Ignavibacteria bacterium]|jgi:aspartyl-tRNA(Asn)/glutamyl-tRNA(Gln) amidotransferase subunit B|nr:Asp-tRNA(Asn)/Glu-tRNA(Gln) amidotransferase subunit GatB [Bacteroidota bacterium]MCZ2131984.1 Asp-tRNA(Asn)/Glu-tRNA(Gln) amidotransferase subunit GatB [Bacteroidota bacterium]
MTESIVSNTSIVETNSEYEAVIGLEVHAQLLTESKAFCGCSSDFGALPNTNVCPVCLGHPGSLPKLNRNLVEFILKMGLATGCKIREHSIFSRKNYFYADLPKGYQISQYSDPICYDGKIEIELGDGATKRIGITRIHMEEDTGKSIHDLDIDTLIDYNRCGVPLIEIVSEPDIRSATEAYQYLMQIRQIVMYLGICDGNLEEGSLRCDANVSVRKRGSTKFGVKTEVKNLNSFRNVEKAIGYETDRQIALIKSGGFVTQETRMWDASSQQTKLMRSKEQAHDYRYFPEPDLAGVYVNAEWVERVKSVLPELPMERKQRFMNFYGLPRYDAGIFVEDKSLSDFFERCAGELETKSADRFKAVSNWIMTEVMRILSDRKIGINELAVLPKHIAELVELFVGEVVSSKIAKEIFSDVLANGKSPKVIVSEKNLAQISDVAQIEKAVSEILAANGDNVEKYKAGKTNLFGFFVSQTLKATGGRANPRIVTEELQRQLNAV